MVAGRTFIMPDTPDLTSSRKPTPFQAGPFKLEMGLRHLDLDEWITVDAAMPSELAERRRLLEERHDDVFAAAPDAMEGSQETLDLLVEHLSLTHPAIYCLEGRHIHNRATNESFDLDAGDLHPLEVAGRLVQEDLCLMRQSAPGADYILSAACLCFPTKWALAEKIGRALDVIHDVVPGYETSLSRSVNGLFERLLPERSVERFNWSILDDPSLYQPTGRGRADDASHVTGENAGDRLWLRVERQTIRRLPTTRDVLFTIRVYVRPLAELAQTPADALRLAAALDGMGSSMRAYKGLSELAGGAIEWLRRAGS